MTNTNIDPAQLHERIVALEAELAAAREEAEQQCEEAEQQRRRAECAENDIRELEIKLHACEADWPIDEQRRKFQERRRENAELRGYKADTELALRRFCGLIRNSGFDGYGLVEKQGPEGCFRVRERAERDLRILGLWREPAKEPTP